MYWHFWFKFGRALIDPHKHWAISCISLLWFCRHQASLKIGTHNRKESKNKNLWKYSDYYRIADIIEHEKGENYFFSVFLFVLFELAPNMKSVHLLFLMCVLTSGSYGCPFGYHTSKRKGCFRIPDTGVRTGIRNLPKQWRHHEITSGVYYIAFESSGALQHRRDSRGRCWLATLPRWPYCIWVWGEVDSTLSQTNPVRTFT